MKKIKSVQQVLNPPAPHMVGDGFRVHNFFPNGYNLGLYRMSPFFLMDYNSKIEFSPREEPRGVGVHPHRGFETVTIAYHGKIAHHDSAGNHGVIGEGGVQWMTAGSGVLHKEYHEKEYSQKGGAFQMVQLWVNLPAKYKMTTPKYQGFENEDFKRLVFGEDKGYVEVIAGDFQGVKGAASTFTPINVYNIYLKKGANIDFSLLESHNTGILVVEGESQFNGKDIAHTDDFVLFRNDGTDIAITATQDSMLLVLSGESIQEPLVPYGPFLMNTRAEILQAYDDLSKGKFGILEA